MIPTQSQAHAIAARLHRYGFIDTAALINALSARVWPDRYGRRCVVAMYAEINALRRAIRAEGTEDIQAAWDAMEEHIDFAYGGAKDERL